eukprot:g7525.t1
MTTLSMFSVSTGLRYAENDPIPPSVLILPNVTSHIVSVTVTFENENLVNDVLNNFDFAGSAEEFNVYYTIDSVEDPSPYLQNGFWYDSANPPVITQSGNTTIKAIGTYFVKGKMYTSTSISSQTYSIVSCEQDLYFVYMSSSYVDPTWSGGLATDTLSSQYVFSHDDVRNPALVLTDANTTTTGVGTYSVTTTGSTSQYIAISFPSYVHVSRVRLSPLHIDRWDANDLNGQYVLNDTLANTSMSCWRVFSASGFVGLGSFMFDTTCA